jgi:DNA-binding NarL/FixJ family response regulator
LRTAQPEDLAFAVRQALQRSVYLVDEGQQWSSSPPAPATVVPAAHGLTRRELEILRLVADGSSNGQLAKKLWVTEQTVKFHLSNIYRKLDVANRTEASRWAQLNGLLPVQREPVTVS